MIHIITAVGVLMCIVALAGIAAPSLVAGLASRVAASGPMRIAAVAVRILFGGICILVADQTPYPWTMKILGVVAIMAGTVVAMLDQATLERWLVAVRQNNGRLRAVCLAALAAGAFLIHASL